MMIINTTTSHRSLNNKTISEWTEEVRCHARHFTIKYEGCFGGSAGKRFTPHQMRFYRDTKDIYSSLYQVLSHLKKYHNIIDAENCLSCKFDSNHVKKLEKDFARWRSHILKCQDGFRYAQVTVKEFTTNHAI